MSDRKALEINDYLRLLYKSQSLLLPTHAELIHKYLNSNL